MFVRFFRSSFATQYVIIIVTGLLVWGKAFVHPGQVPAPEGPVPLYNLIWSGLSAYPVISTILGFIITLCSAFLLNNLMVRNEIVSKNSSLSGFLFIIFTGFHPVLLILNPVSIVLFFLMLIVSSLFGSYNKSESLDLIYLSGFLAGIGSLIYFPFLAFYGFILVALILFRSSNWREWLSSLIGLVTPYLFLSVWYFWKDEFIVRSNIFIHSFIIYASPAITADLSFFILAGFIFLLMLTGWLNSLAHLSEKTIEIRKKTIILNWLVLFVLASFFFGSRLQIFHFILIAGSVCVLTSIYLMSLKKSFWQEIILIAFFLSILVNNLLISG